MTANSIILCPSARLARSIQNDIAQQQIQLGISQWQSPNVQTLSQWLEKTIEEALLTAAIEETTPPYALSAFNEQLLWEDVIAQSLKNNAFGDLFDLSGLASVAIEANRYMIAWKLHVPSEHQAEETRQFLRWQRAFQQRCRELNALESVRYMDWQLTQLAQLPNQLPVSIKFAGFDQTAPQEQRLRDILMRLGVALSEYVTTAEHPAQTQHVQLDDEDAELRAAVAWVAQQLSHNPNAKLAIVTPTLSEVRNKLADLLDEEFYPLTVRPGFAQLQRHYNFSLGTPLTQQPMIQAGLNLLRMMTSYQLQQADVSTLLLSPFWSASIQEADARAVLDAKMREKLPMQFSLARLLEFIQQQSEQGLALSSLINHLNAATAISISKRQPATVWAQTFTQLLEALVWNGERTVNSLEYQALNAWKKALQQLAKLDVLDKKLSAQAAVNYLQQICSNQIFQAETELEPLIQILGIMEGLSAPVDAIWCMHMNDHIWPPPARPNPLLPAFIQRVAGLPGADNSVQATFAATIQQRLLHSAHTIVFSSSKMQGESQLRASPLMQSIATHDADVAFAQTLAEKLSVVGHAELANVDDHMAPVVNDGEHVHGGTGLLKAQAVCPAWAFYQYRLGAKALKTASAGLDNMDRGSLVHGVLEQFWRKRHFADLRDMRADVLQEALTKAVNLTIQAFAAESSIASAAVLELEAERLLKLVGEWLQYEKDRAVSFRIVDCEIAKKVHICGIEVTLQIDRVHQLENGGLEFVDYKTGQLPKTKSWGEDRITEPQLPIYATFYSDAEQHVAGVYFGMVKLADYDFSGISEANFEAEQDKRKPQLAKEFSDWSQLLNHWKTAIESIAQELRSGEAAVRFSDEAELAYCEVTPLLRLPERKLQFERFQEVSK
ncbi:MAG: DNA helicase [Methylotenera sp. 17-45-7]|nr:MAG: DNA helicase [Methylotenera sp. 17-45-7]HQS42793.1 PD-(D/E)XK nuclease family protein [Methylotenera sp.]